MEAGSWAGFATEEEIDAFVYEKVHGNLLPFEKVKRPRGSGNTLRAQERTLRAIIAAASSTGLANRSIVRELTGYSEETHRRVVCSLRRKGAIGYLYEHRWQPKRRSYVVCATWSAEGKRVKP